MAAVIIPHFPSMLRWLGRPRLLTRLSSLCIANPEVSAQMHTRVHQARTTGGIGHGQHGLPGAKSGKCTVRAVAEIITLLPGG